MSKLQKENFEIDVIENDKIKITWSGRCDFKDAASLLLPFFTDIIKQNKNKKKEFEISFLNLQYMNSATIMPILKFIRDLNLNKINSVLVYNKNLEWQKKSFEALKMVASELDFIEIINN